MCNVSIHAFRGEGDFVIGHNIEKDEGFNPRLPGGRRRGWVSLLPSATSFNPRLPGGRRRVVKPRFCADKRFNPRLPGGRRPDGDLQRLYRRVVSIHAFRGEGDIRSQQ